MINLTPPQFTISVGELNITSLVQQLSLRQDALDITRPIFWQGTMAIARTKSWAGESLDDFANPTRWARGRHPVTLTIAGTLFATLRIGGYSYNEDLDSAEVTLTQYLDLLDYKTPPEDYRFFSETNIPQTIPDIVEPLLTAAGLPEVNLSDYVGDVVIPPPDRSGRSYIELAQEILGERGWWLYHTEDETVKVRSVDFDRIKTFERERATLVEFNRQVQRDIVPNVYRVIGGGEIFVGQGSDEGLCALDEILNRTEDIYGLEATIRNEYGVFGPNGFTYIRTISSERNIVQERVVTQTTINTPAVLQVTTTTYRRNQQGFYKTKEALDTQYFDDQGRLIKQVRTMAGFGYTFLDVELTGIPNSFYDQVISQAYLNRWFPLVEENIVEYYTDPTRAEAYNDVPTEFIGAPELVPREYDTGVIRLRIETNKKLLYDQFITGGTPLLDFYIQTLNKTYETWVEACYDYVDTTFFYRRRVYVPYGGSARMTFTREANMVKGIVTRIPSTLRLSEQVTANDFSEAPPNWTNRPPIYPRENISLLAEVRRRYPGSDDDLVDKREFEYSAKSITTQAEAHKLASFFADLTLGRAFGYEAVLSLREATEIIADPTPLQTVWFHNRVLLLDSPSLVFDGKEAELSWEAVTLQTLSPPVGGENPVATDLVQKDFFFLLPMMIRSPFSTRAISQIDAPDIDWIEVDGNGDVVTSGGYVQASQNEGQFAQILVESGGSVVVSADGNAVTTALDPYGSLWDTIATLDGDILTLNGEVVTI